MKISLSAGSRSWQSASFPGSDEEERALLRRAMSRAFRAASRAWKESTALATMRFASSGFSSKKRTRRSYTTRSTKPCMALLPSLVFVCPSNWGSETRTLMTAVSPTRVSSPRTLRPLRSFPAGAEGA